MRIALEFVKFFIVLWLQALIAFAAIGIATWIIGGLFLSTGKEIFSISVLSFWGFIYLACGTLAAIGAAIIFLRDSKDRGIDRYRFSRTQLRHVEIGSPPNIRELETTLGRLGYFNVSIEEDSDGSAKVRATRSGVLSFHPLKASESRPTLLTESTVTFWIERDGKILISVKPNRWYIYGDYNNARYFLLEELLDELKWGPYCKERRQTA